MYGFNKDMKNHVFGFKIKRVVSDVPFVSKY